MEFFIPHTEGKEEAEGIFTSIAKFIGADATQKKIFKITYIHNGKDMSAEVGKNVDSYYQESMPEVIAIFKHGQSYCICLPERGVAKGSPILVGASRGSTRVEYFEE